MSKPITINMSHKDFKTIAKIIDKYRHSDSSSDDHYHSVKLPKFDDYDETDDFITLFVKLRYQLKHKIGPKWNVYLDTSDSLKIGHHHLLGITVTNGDDDSLSEIAGAYGKRLGWSENISDPHTLYCVNSIMRSFCHYINIPFHLTNINGNSVDNL